MHRRIICAIKLGATAKRPGDSSARDLDFGMGGWHDHGTGGATGGRLKMAHIMFKDNLDEAFMDGGHHSH